MLQTETTFCYKIVANFNVGIFGKQEIPKLLLAV